MPARTAALHRGVHGLRAAIPAGGGRCRKDRFLRSPPLPSPVLTLTSAQGAGGTLGSPPGGSWGPGLQGTCPPGPGRGRAGRAACCSGRRPGAGVVGGVKPRPPLLPFAGYGFQAGHLIHNPPPQSGAGGASSSSLPQILPRAWMCGGCARPRSVRQPPGSGRESGEHLRPYPSRFPTGVWPPFLRACAGLPFALSQVPSGLGFASRADLLTSSPAAVSDVYFCCSSYASLWQGLLRADGYLFL